MEVVDAVAVGWLCQLSLLRWCCHHDCWWSDCSPRARHRLEQRLRVQLVSTEAEVVDAADEIVSTLLLSPETRH